MNNRTHFVVGAGSFIAIDDTLFTWESFDVLTHEQNAGDTEETPIIQWNEDGVIADFTFSLQTDKNAVLNALSVSLIATDGTNTIELDRVNVVLNPNIGNPPVIATNDTRNYILPTNSEFNLVKIENGVSALPKQFYEGVIGQKITWQEWITQNNVPALFLDLNQLNQGLNKKSSNYSNQNGYQIYLKGIAEVTGDDSTQGTITRTYERLSSPIRVYDYFESDDGVIIDGIVQTFDESGNNDLNGSYFPNANTLFSVRWQGAALLDVNNIAYIIHRIESKFALSNTQIEESSTLRGIVANGKLTAINTAQDGNDIISTCFIKAGSLTSGDYKLSARMKLLDAPNPFSWILISLHNPDQKASVFTARVDINANNKSFFSVNSATVSNDYLFTIGDTGSDLDNANAARWSSFTEINFATFNTSAISANTKVKIRYTGTNTDTDILSAIRVATSEIPTPSLVSNTVFSNSDISAYDLLLPFQTLHDIAGVLTSNSCGFFSEVRTDAEISAGQNLLDFNSGIGSLVNLGLNATGHLFLQPTTTSRIGQITLQSLANDVVNGNIIGIASPLQNQYHPFNINPSAAEFDLFDDFISTTNNNSTAYLDFASIPNGNYIEIFTRFQFQSGGNPNARRIFGLTNQNNSEISLGVNATGTTIFLVLANNFAVNQSNQLRFTFPFQNNAVYNLYFRTRKLSNNGNTSAKLDLSESFAVVNNLFIPLTSTSSTYSLPIPSLANQTLFIGGSNLPPSGVNAQNAMRKMREFSAHVGVSPVLNLQTIRQSMLANETPTNVMGMKYNLNNIGGGIVLNTGTNPTLNPVTQSGGVLVTNLY